MGDDADDRAAMITHMAGSKARAAPPSRHERLQLQTGAEDEFKVVVNNAIKFLDDEQQQRERVELEARNMRRSNAQLPLLFMVHRKRGPPTRFLFDAPMSIHLSEVQAAREGAASPSALVQE